MTGRIMGGVVIVLAGAISAGATIVGPARAEWREAKSRHFTVYADTSEADIQAMATRLERFDATLRRLTRTDDDPAKAANGVTIYVTPSADGVRTLCGKGDWCRNIAGFYVPRVSGSVAFTPKRGGGDGGLNPQIVLFHEYAHHFLLGSHQAAYPAWFSEGYAEFVATTTFEKDYVQVGVAAQHRAYGLYSGDALSAKALFATGNPKLSDAQRESVYSRGWLLTHYLMFDPVRGPHLQAYLRLLNDGTPSIDAAIKAFGDLKKLDRDADAYLRRSTIPGLRVPYATLGTPAVAVRALTPGEAALIRLRMRSTRGVNRETATPLYAEAARAAAPYPNDARSQGWLAEMAYDAGQDDAAEAAADRAIAADPKSVQALLYKARVRLRRAQAAKATDPKVWGEARGWIVKANRVATDDADVLASFYRAFQMQGVPPTKNAVAGLVRAVELVPQDPSLRFAAAGQFIQDKDLPAARAMLRPLAFDPHAGADNPAAKLIALIDSGKVDPAALNVEADSGA